MVGLQCGRYEARIHSQELRCCCKPSRSKGVGIFVYCRGASHSAKIISSLYSRQYVEAGNEWRGLSSRLSSWATQKRGSGDESLATVSECRSICNF